MPSEPTEEGNSDLARSPDEESELEIQEDVKHQVKVWRIQRIGWVCLAAICASALLGFFGDGWAADVTKRTSGLEIHYERFLRFGHPSEIEITISSGDWPSSAMELESDFLKWAHIEAVEPHPDALKPTASGLTIDTNAMRGHPTLRIRYEPMRLGRHTFQLKGPEGVMLDARCWVYP